MTLRRKKIPNGTNERLDRAEQVARDHARRLMRLEIEVGIIRPSPYIRKERPS